MDAIKQKMDKLTKETQEAERRTELFEGMKDINEAEADKFDDQLKNIGKKIQGMESAYDVCNEDLFNQTVKIEEMEKKCSNADQEVSSLRSRLILLQENAEKQEDRLAKATLELANRSQNADSSIRKRIGLENAEASNEASIDSLDKQLCEAKITLADSESKFETISRKLATLEADAVRSNVLADGAEKRIYDIEEELKIVGQNLQTLEVGEEKTLQREEESQEEINELVHKLMRSEYRGEQALMHVQRLNVRIDQVEEDLLTEKFKIQKANDELNQTFDDMLNVSG